MSPESLKKLSSYRSHEIAQKSNGSGLKIRVLKKLLVFFFPLPVECSGFNVVFEVSRRQREFAFWFSGLLRALKTCDCSPRLTSACFPETFLCSRKPGDGRVLGLHLVSSCR